MKIDKIDLKNYHPWPDWISRPIAPVSSVAGGDVTTSPIPPGQEINFLTYRLPGRGSEPGILEFSLFSHRSAYLRKVKQLNENSYCFGRFNFIGDA
jgi:hypothetical protein